MKRFQKWNKISWSPDVNLSEVRFVSGNSPSHVGLEAQDCLQTKPSWMLQSNGMDSSGLPSGFDVNRYTKLSKIEPSNTPWITWKCPPKLILNQKWCVVAGEESTEAEAQKGRETRVVEAVYSRHTPIPLNPSNLVNIEESHYDDRRTRIIPVTPIEEAEGANDLQSVLAQPGLSSHLPLSSGATECKIPGLKTESADVPAAASAAFTEDAKDLQSVLAQATSSGLRALLPLSSGAPECKIPAGLKTESVDVPTAASVAFTEDAKDFQSVLAQPGLSSHLPLSSGAPKCKIPAGLETESADVSAAASAAFTVMMKSMELGTLIDTNLLISILSDPETANTLIKDYKPVSSLSNGSAQKPVSEAVLVSLAGPSSKSMPPQVPVFSAKSEFAPVLCCRPEPNTLASPKRADGPSYPFKSMPPHVPVIPKSVPASVPCCRPEPNTTSSPLPADGLSYPSEPMSPHVPAFTSKSVSASVPCCRPEPNTTLSPLPADGLSCPSEPMSPHVPASPRPADGLSCPSEPMSPHVRAFSSKSVSASVPSCRPEPNTALSPRPADGFSCPSEPMSPHVPAFHSRSVSTSIPCCRPEPNTVSCPSDGLSCPSEPMSPSKSMFASVSCCRPEPNTISPPKPEDGPSCRPEPNTTSSPRPVDGPSDPSKPMSSHVPGFSSKSMSTSVSCCGPEPNTISSPRPADVPSYPSFTISPYVREFTSKSVFASVSCCRPEPSIISSPRPADGFSYPSNPMPPRIVSGSVIPSVPLPRSEIKNFYTFQSVVRPPVTMQAHPPVTMRAHAPLPLQALLVERSPSPSFPGTPFPMRPHIPEHAPGIPLAMRPHLPEHALGIPLAMRPHLPERAPGTPLAMRPHLPEHAPPPSSPGIPFTMRPPAPSLSGIPLTMRPERGQSPSMPGTFSTMRPGHTPSPLFSGTPTMMRPPVPEPTPLPSFSAAKAPPVKDFNYYKNLVKEHGGENGKPVDHMKITETKPIFQKPCKFFNSSVGCGKGSRCPYRHDMMDVSQSAKRIRLDGQINEPVRRF